MKIITHVPGSGGRNMATYRWTVRVFVIKGKLRHVENDPKGVADMCSGTQ